MTSSHSQIDACEHDCVASGDAFSTGTSGRSPGRLVIYIIKIHIYRIKILKRTLTFILEKASLVARYAHVRVRLVVVLRPTLHMQ